MQYLGKNIEFRINDIMESGIKKRDGTDDARLNYKDLKKSNLIPSNKYYSVI